MFTLCPTPEFEMNTPCLSALERGALRCLSLKKAQYPVPYVAIRSFCCPSPRLRFPAAIMCPRHLLLFFVTRCHHLFRYERVVPTNANAELFRAFFLLFSFTRCVVVVFSLLFMSFLNHSARPSGTQGSLQRCVASVFTFLTLLFECAPLSSGVSMAPRSAVAERRSNATQGRGSFEEGERV